ncbi:hypothetical protein GOP47_0009372 [Adiantum capillus-veneris]|uniref:Cytochrome b561 domain-containing protein n=1 Tax=Adiantum capillus-veneris TaxID=13818 RepID=A0A9D4ZJG3_ADICA|nr:hypothetical protein GOP47_0009372 [Adiantum capillus-veneris]
MDSWRSTLSPWGVQPRPFAYVSHFFGLVSVLFVFIWSLYFRGGMNFNSSNTNHIFNVHPPLMLLGLVFLAGEAIMAYKTVPGDKATRKFALLVWACHHRPLWSPVGSWIYYIFLSWPGSIFKDSNPTMASEQYHRKVQCRGHVCECDWAHCGSFWSRSIYCCNHTGLSGQQ